MLFQPFILSSYACSIPFEPESVIVTGGWWSGYEKKVTKYIWNPTLGSSSEDWPQLLEARAYHACGKYVDSNNNNVIFQKVVIWTDLFICRCFWYLEVSKESTLMPWPQQRF